MALVFSAGAAAWSADGTTQKAGRPTAEQIRFFEKTIRPLLAKHCYECHGADEQESELRLDSLPGMLTGGKGGASVTSRSMTRISPRSLSLDT